MKALREHGREARAMINRKEAGFSILLRSRVSLDEFEPILFALLLV
jgi:hypothetical protein